MVKVLSIVYLDEPVPAALEEVQDLILSFFPPNTGARLLADGRYNRFLAMWLVHHYRPNCEIQGN
jgi:hypothetical protein